VKLEKSVLFTLLICVFFPFVSNADQLEDAISAIENKDYRKAYELLQPLAEEGNVEAQTHLGAMYVNGQGIERDLDKGLSWIMKAAEQGNETAKSIAFKVHLDLVNQGVPADEKKATYWSNLSAAFAAGIDGTWSGEVPGFGGQPMKLSFTFERDGNRLKGTILGFGGQKNRLRDGKIDGNDFSFRVKSSFFGMRTTTKYTGTFLGDRLKLTYTTKTSAPRRRVASVATISGGESPPMTLIAKRVE
jgi:hypothetical protein